MQSTPVRNPLYAGMLFCSVLLAFTPASAYAQRIRSSGERQPSLISVAPAVRPEGERLARRAGDATFRHAPANYHVFSAATAGEDAGVEPIVLNFAGETRLTRIESKSKDFVIEPGGTCREGKSLRRGDSCSLLVRFNPQGPGHRLGHLEIADSADAQPLDVGLVGNGYAPVISFVPSEITTVAGTYASGAGILKSAANMTVDGGDILYIADTGNNMVREIDSSGTIKNISPAFSSSTPASVAVDSFGDIWADSVSGSSFYLVSYSPFGESTYWQTAYKSGSSCTASAPCNFDGVGTPGMEDPAEIGIDSNDNLFMEEETQGALEMPIGPYAASNTLSPTMDMWYLDDKLAYQSGSAATFAVDPNDNLYTVASNTSVGTCFIVEESIYGAEEGDPTFTRVAGGENCGFSGDGGQAGGAEVSSSIGQIAFDAAGDLYFTDSGNQRVRRIDYNTGIIRKIAGNGAAGYTGDFGPATAATLSTPTGIAVDSQGQVYIISSDAAAGTSQVVRKVGASGYLSFGSQADGTSSAAQPVLVTDTGNSDMTLTGVLLNGADPGDFAIDPNTTTCNLTAGGSSYIGSNLNTGQSCQIGILFSPKAAGTRQANLVLLDNTVIGTDTVVLDGTGTLSTATMKITSPASGTSFASGSTVTFTVKVTGVSGVPAPTGTVQFKVDGSNFGSAVAISSGAATTTLTDLKSGAHTLAATYSGDANYAGAGPVSESITIKAAAVKVRLERVSGAAQSCASTAFSVAVTSSGSPGPTGKVELLDANGGGKVLATGTLAEGKATLRANLSNIANAELVAHYAGDTRHLPGDSAELNVTTTKTVPCEVK